MKPISVPVLILLAGGLAQPVTRTATAQTAPIPTEAVYTNTTRFRIPYQFDAAQLQKLNAKRIRLYVSTDRGGNWRPAQTVSPQAGRFDFQVPAEGEYWFAVRTLIAENRLYPAAPLGDPELKVVVDTTPPSLDVRLREAEAGKVELTWRANDSHLDPSTLQLEYLQTDESRWQPVGIDPQPRGQTSWSIPDGGVVAVRGSVRDRAGNVGRSQARTTIAPAEKNVPEPELPPLREPIAAGSLPSELQDPGQSLPANGPQILSESDLTENGSAGVGSADLSPIRDLQHLQSEQPERPDKANRGHVEQRKTIRSPVGRTRIVNSHTFRIDYKIEDAGPSGVEAVELYITENGGRKWYKYGDDPDRRSPFEVEVPRDGTYGFSLRVRNGSGLADDPPQPGETPSIMITVDATPPKARILPMQRGRGRSSNRVLIQWDVTDQRLADRPIALSYSSDSEGPWKPISSRQPNTGEYVWEIGPGMPSVLYLRLTARDAAGNITRVKTPEPIVIDLSKPSARIVGVESVDDSERR